MARPSFEEGIIAKRYGKFATDRQQYIDRGRQCAWLTIPSILPRHGAKNTKLVAPYQGIGARGVNNLSAKLLLALFPPNVPFFRLAIDDFQLAKLAQSDELRGEVEQALSKFERAIALDIETTAIRVPLFEALKHLIVVGNILLYRDPDTGRSRAIPLTHYVVRRDHLGTVLEVIVHERIALSLLPEAVAAQVRAKHAHLAEDEDIEEVPLYTRIVRSRTKWEVTQEAAGAAIDTGNGGYPLDQCPWIPLRMILMDGEHYGRSFVEEHYSDLFTLEMLRKAIVQAAAAAAKVVFLVKPNATTKAKDLAKAESGDFIQGSKDDIDVLQLEKYNDLQVAEKTSDSIEQSLSYAFLLNSALQRNAERVTAEEIRRLAQELDTSLGGVHALLAQELQLPLVSIIMAAKTRKKEIPKLPKGFVSPVVVTGVDALGRGTDLDNLEQIEQAVANIPNALQRIKGDEWIKRVCAAVQVDSAGLFMTDQEVQQQQQQQQAAQMAQAATPNATAAIGQAVNQPQQGQ